MKWLKLFWLALVLASFSQIGFSQKIKVRSSSSRIEKGDSVLISWEATGKYTIFTASFTPEQLPAKGEFWVKPDSTSRFLFSIQNKKNKAVNRTVSIDVFEPQLIRFYLQPNGTDESPVEANWLAQDVLYVRFKQQPDSFDYYGKTYFSFDTTSTVCIEMVGKYKTIDSCLTTIIEPVENFECTPRIYVGAKAKLKWKFKRARNVKIAGMAQSFSTTHELIVQPDSTTTYKLLVYRNSGVCDTFSKTVEVVYPVLDYFKAPGQLVVMEKGIVSWSVEGAPFVTLNGDTVKSSGMITIQSDTPDTLDFSLSFKSGKGFQQYLKTVYVQYDRPFLDETKTKADPKSRLFCDIISIDQSKYPDSVKMHVLLVDSTGQFISNIAINNNTKSQVFPALVENIAGKTYNMPFTIREIKENTNKYDIALVLDHSGSMDGVIEHLEKAIKRFIKKKHPDDRVSVIKFDDSLGYEMEFTDTADAILKKFKFNGLQNYGGSTALFAATDYGREILDSAKSLNQKVIVLFTDGNENSSLFYFGRLAVSAQHLAFKLRNSGVKLIVVSYGDGVNKQLLNTLARLSGGFYYPLLRTKQIDAVFNEIPRVLHKYYEITYKPIKADGEHTLVLKYNTRQQISQTTAMLHIGNNFKFTHSDFDTSAYWYDPPAGMLPVAMPQVVALFPFDDARLQQGSFAKLDKLAELLLSKPELMIDVLGHTDLKGSHEYCDKLSLQRAEAMKSYLISKGVPDARIRVKAFGKRAPIWSPDKDKWKSLENRRVEVVMYSF